MGDASVTPLTANAPVYGDTYQPHVDADPTNLPPSPWTDIYGRYPNRAKGKPRLMTALIYLNQQWNTKKWGGHTRVWNSISGNTVDIDPIPGRVVFMDQDVWHSVRAPNIRAGKCPRYSLACKLILHPRYEDQDMEASLRHSPWPEPHCI